MPKDRPPSEQVDGDWPMADEATAPIAIVGHACRLPDASTPQAFWGLMLAGRSAIRPMADRRWPAERFAHPGGRRPGRSYTDAAALVEGIWDFDAGAFGLSRREAEQMDPQQRLLLMVAVEALEDAGHPPQRLSRERVGVFVGCSASDHGQAFFDRPEAVDAGFMTGNTLSIVANRISHVLDLDGPSVTLDTACSSSLYALDHAVRSLRSGEIDTALVGAVHALLSPLPFIGFSQAGMLSPSGNLRPFDAAADGYVRGEGAVAFVLTRAHRARAEGDRVHAEILATGTGASGRTGGIARPDSARQAALLSRVLRRTDRLPEDIAFVEAHGTGTPAGDPAEAAAIAEAFGRGRPNPLPIGSVKGNIGHLEPAAGAAGLLKAVLALEHGQLPPTAGFEEPSPKIALERLGLTIGREARPLSIDTRHIAAVNSFGFGGANACVLLRQGPADPGPVTAEAKALVLSAESEAALEKTLSRWRAGPACEAPTRRDRLINVAGHRRAWKAHRIVLNSQGEELAGGLAKSTGGNLVFAFSGNGGQFVGMGADLHRSDDAYREAHDRTADLFATIDPEQDPRRHLTDSALPFARATVAQPALFALQVGLVESLRLRGLRPAAAIGHSLGEVAAAWCAGALTLEDAVRLIATRAPLVESLAGTGGMAAVRAAPEVVEALISSSGAETLALSAENAPESCTVSGSVADLASFASHARAERVAVRRLDIRYPYHSGALDSLKQAFDAERLPIRPRAPEIPLASSTLGRLVDGDILDMAFWWRNLREPVRFRAAAKALAAGDRGVGPILEIGPRPILARYIEDCLAETGHTANVVPTLGADNRGDTMERIAARAVANGAQPDLARYVGARAPHADGLPPRVWTLERLATPDTAADADIWRSPEHPLLGTRIRGAVATWERDVDLALLPWLSDHAVGGRPTMPASALFEMAQAAGRLWRAEPTELLRASLSAPLVAGQTPKKVRTRIEPESGCVLIESRAPGARDWVCHLQGSLRPDPRTHTTSIASRPGPREVIEPAWLYAELSDEGLVYGPRFRLVSALRIGDARAEVDLADSSPLLTGTSLCPARLDAACHALLPLIRAAVPDHCLDGDLLLPARLERFRVAPDPDAAVTADVNLTAASPLGATADIRLRDVAGRTVAEMDGLRLERVPQEGQSALPVRWVERTVLMSFHRAGRSQARPADIARRGLAGWSTDPEIGRLRDAEVLTDALARRLVWDGAGTQGHGPRHTKVQEILSEDSGFDRGAACPYPPPGEIAASLLDRCPTAGPSLLPLFSVPERLELGTNAAGPASREPTDDDVLPRRLLLEEACDRLVAALCGDDRELRTSEIARIPLGTAAAFQLLDRPATASFRAAVLLCGTSCPRREEVAKALAQLAPGAPLFVLDMPPSAADRLLEQTDRPNEASEGIAPPNRQRAANIGALLLSLGCTEHARIPADAEEDGLEVHAARTPRDSTPRTTSERTADTEDPLQAETSLLPGFSSARAHQVSAALSGTACRTGRQKIVLLDTSLAAGDDPASDLLAFLDGLAAMVETDVTSQVWLVSCSHDPTRPLDAGIAAACRVAANEIAPRPLRFVAVTGDTPPSLAAERLAALAEADPAEPEVHISPERTACVRLLPDVPDAPPPTSKAAEAAILTLGRRGDPESLSWQPARRRSPEGDEIEIAVEVAGLNYRDALWVLGMIPSEALEGGYCGAGLGMECAGIVVRAGPRSPIAEGTRVLAVAPHALSTHVTVSGRRALGLPDGMSLAAGAALPVAALTASHALEELARLRAGERVLVHGAAGGVGLASLALARSMGARVIATAGTPAKRRLLSALGAEAVFDSRSLGFGDGIRHITDGAGVDVVLNSLSGNALATSLDLLAPFGRFVELGKRDILTDRRIGLRALKNNISLHAVDLDRLLLERPALADELLARLRTRLGEGTLPPIPVDMLAPNAAPKAVRRLAAGAHIGKLALRPPERIPAARPKTAFSPTGTWLVTGGTSGFGLATARRLARDGARRLWLIGRKDRPSEEASAAIREIRKHGTTVDYRSCDMSDEEAVREVLAEVASAGALEGIVHAAATYADAPLGSIERESAERVLRVKLDGARWLDRYSRALAPARFVLFGSLAARLGTPGQAAYAAANAGLEAIVRGRRAIGLPGLAIAWGPIGDTGHLWRSPELRDRLETALGAPALLSDRALDALMRMLARSDPAPCVTHAEFATEAVARRAPTTVGILLGDRARRRGGSALETCSLAEELSNMSSAAARKHLLEVVCEEVAAVLRQSPEDISPDRPLGQIGLDSLMAVDLALSLERRIGTRSADLSPDTGTTPAGLTVAILEALDKRRPEGAALEARLERRHRATAPTCPESRKEAAH